MCCFLCHWCRLGLSILTCCRGSSPIAACCAHVCSNGSLVETGGHDHSNESLIKTACKSTELLSSDTATAVCTGTHDPGTLQERIEAFLDSSTMLLAELQAEDFERHRQALIAAKLQQCHSLLDESDRHWEQIQTRRCVLTGRHIWVQTSSC